MTTMAMNNFAPMLCSEFKLLVQQVLDGQTVSETYRHNIREHRDSCSICCNFHDNLIGVTALAPEILPPEEFRNRQSSRLWNEILSSVDMDLSAPLARTLSLTPDRGALAISKPLNPLDITKIDTGGSAGHITDLAKFLFGPDEMQCLSNMIDKQHSNPRVEKICFETYELLSRLQNTVSDLPTVVGTMLLSRDGSIIDSRLGANLHGHSSDDIGVWSIAAYHNAQAASNAFGYSRVTQIVSRTEDGYVIIANLRDLTLIVLIDGDEEHAWDLVGRLRAMTN